MAKAKSSGETLKKVLRYTRRHGGFFALSLILAAATVAGTLYIPILAGEAIDCIVGAGQVDFRAVGLILVRIAAVAGAAALLQWLMNTVNNRITYSVVRDLRDEAFKKVERLPLKYLDAHGSGEIVSRIIADADQFADGFLMGFTQFFTGVITIIGTLAFMMAVNYKIALVVVVLTPLSLFTARFIARRTYSMFKLQSETRGEQTALVDELIGGSAVVKAFSHEEESLCRFDEINERLNKYSLKATFFSSLTNPCTRFVNNTVYAAAAFTGALAVLGTAFAWGSFSVGALSCFLSYANQYTKPFNEISGVVTELQNALACAGRIFELIEEEPETADSPEAVALENIRGEVSFERVSFSYSHDKPFIEDMNLKAAPGSRIAIVGPTGCGKTTLINLLMRFYDVDSGSIKVDGRDIKSLTRESLRRGFGMVLQDTWLAEGTVRDNIAMGKPDATDDEIKEAAKASHAHSFIKRLPMGYDTYMGENGAGLSQGQRQLLCIARVMLCRPPMLILDEATSSIDTRTEIKIQKAFLKLMEGRTAFIVAHRLSTVREADMILVMRDGKIIESGKHRELLAAGGFYSHLYNSQFEPTG